MSDGAAKANIRTNLSASTTEGVSTRSSIREWASSHPVLLVFLIALIARVAMSFAATRLFGGALIQPDSLMYHDMASDAATGAVSHWDDFTHSLYLRTITFIGPMVLLYKVFGTVMWIGALYVSVLGAGVAALTAWIAAREISTRAAFIAGGLIALLPSQVFWSSVTLKDPMVWLLLAALALAVSFAARAEGRRLVVWGIAIAMLLVLLGYTRSNSLIVACWALALTSWVGTKPLRMWRVAGGVLIAISVPWILGLGPAGWSLINGKDPADMRVLNAVGAESAVVDTSAYESANSLEQRAAEIEAAAERLAALAGSGGGGDDAREAQRLRVTAAELRARALALRRNAATTTQMSAEEAKDTSVPLDDSGTLAPNLRHLPKGISVMLLEPYPWSGGASTSLRLAQFETIMWYPVVFLAAIGTFFVLKRRGPLLFALVVGAATVGVYALTEGNLGTAYRHRGEFVWVTALLAAAGVATATGWLRRRRVD